MKKTVPKYVIHNPFPVNKVYSTYSMYMQGYLLDKPNRETRTVLFSSKDQHHRSTFLCTYDIYVSTVLQGNVYPYLEVQ